MHPRVPYQNPLSQQKHILVNTHTLERIHLHYRSKYTVYIHMNLQGHCRRLCEVVATQQLEADLDRLTQLLASGQHKAQLSLQSSSSSRLHNKLRNEPAAQSHHQAEDVKAVLNRL
jgi:hypothetical protein